MGQPYGSMSKRKERVDAVAAFIHGGGTPTLATISEQYGISPASARRTIQLALDQLAGRAPSPRYDSDKKMLARHRVLCRDISFGGGFATLSVEFITMWGEVWGVVRRTYDVAGKFQHGRLPYALGLEIAEDCIAACTERWGDFVCDLTPRRVLEALSRQEVCWETPSACRRAIEHEAQAAARLAPDYQQLNS